MSKKIIMLVLCCLSFAAFAVDAPFWQPADKARSLSPEPRPQKFLLEPLGDPSAAFTGYAGQLPPKVPPRQQQLIFYPCSQCHTYWETNPNPRQLAPVHAVGLQHGQGRMWCLVCHEADNRDRLHTLQGDPVDFDEAWRVCGQCHAARQKDWFFGAHGKRVYAWQGEAERYNCTHCHDPHRPRFTGRKPQPKPAVRAGLQPMRFSADNELPRWKQKLEKFLQDQNNE